MNSFNSGKTQFAIQLGRFLSEAGRSVEYFKPLSGHNYWFNHEHTEACMDMGILASLDAMNVRKHLNTTSPIELANPVHSLFVPLRLEKPLQTLANTLGLSGTSSVLTLQRFSRPLGSKIDTTVLVAEQLVEEERLIIRQEEVGKLTVGAAIQPVRNLEEVQYFEQLNFEGHVTESFAAVEKAADIAIIEGFNDSAWPWDGLKHVDVVLLISPAHVFSYDTERFRKAVYLMNRGNLPIREVTFSRISDLLKPMNRVEFRPDSNISSDDLTQLGILLRTGKND